MLTSALISLFIAFQLHALLKFSVSAVLGLSTFEDDTPHIVSCVNEISETQNIQLIIEFTIS